MSKGEVHRTVTLSIDKVIAVYFAVVSGNGNTTKKRLQCSGKSPKMCGWKIYVICFYQLFRQSCSNAPANTSYSSTLLRIISWSLQ